MANNFQLKTMWENLSQEIKNLAKRYQITLVGLLLCVVSCIIMVQLTFSSETGGEEIIVPLIAGAVMATFGLFFTETMANGQKRKWIGYVISGLIGLAFAFWTHWIIESQANDIVVVTYFSLMGCYAVFLLALSVRHIMKEKRISFHDYLLGYVVRSWLVGLVLSAIYSVIGIPCLIYEILLAELLASGERVIISIYIFLFGMVSIPSVIYCLYTTKEQNRSWLKVLITYILQSIVLLAVLLIDLYLLLVFLQNKVPSNVLFLLTAITFTLGMIVATFSDAAAKDGKGKKFTKIACYIQGPLLIVQGYALFARVLAYGFTPSRYFGLFALIAEVIYYLLFLVFPKKRDWILPILAGLLTIILVVPGLNFHHVSAVSQTVILNRYLENRKEEDYERAKGAFYYLRTMDQDLPLSVSKMPVEKQKELDQIFPPESPWDPNWDDDTMIYNWETGERVK